MKYIKPIIITLIALEVVKVAVLVSVITKEQKYREQEVWLQDTAERIEGLEATARTTQKQCLEELYSGEVTNGV